jgi:uncharacterized membrane protein
MARSMDSSAVPAVPRLRAKLLRDVDAIPAAPAVERSRERDRVLAIDALRGAAMLFVGISHTRYYSSADHGFASLLKWIGFLAAPAFLVVSGIACGYQFSKSTARETISRIIDRGLFVLVMGHLLVCGSLWYEVTGNVFEHIVITDTIGLCICLCPLLRHLSARRLVFEGIGLFVVTCVVASYWQPSSAAGQVIGATLFGIYAQDLREHGWVTPSLAYFAMFLVGMGIGRLIGELRAGREARSGSEHRLGSETDSDSASDTRALANRLFFVGSMAALAAVVANVLGHFGKPAMLHAIAAGEHWVGVLLASTEVRQQMPPMPAYALFYCGIAVAVLGGLLRLFDRERSRVVMRPVQVAAVIGRASFISYVCIQWLIDFLPKWIGLDASLRPGTALLYLVLVMVVVFLIAAVWDRQRANRYLTFGFSSAG